MVEGLKEFFEELDRRVNKVGKWGNKSLYEILMVVMCGVAGNGKTILDILGIAKYPKIYKSWHNNWAYPHISSILKQ